jgi:c(7)-type cytochrome triheme protein
MRIRFIVAVLLVGLGFAGVALAVPPGKTLTFDKSPSGKVLFDGKIHKEAGAQCAECHNADTFPKMKQGTVSITMEQIYAGKLCGVCHIGQRAFEAKSNCNRCHLGE